MGDCLEQPQAAGIPEKALCFTCLPFLLLLRFAALGVGTSPPSLSSHKIGGGGNAAAASGSCVGRCTAGLWRWQMTRSAVLG